MADIDARTGVVIDNYASALQSVESIFSTRRSSRVMGRELGAGLIELLGRKMTPRLFLVFQTLVKVAIDAWEPRFSVRDVLVRGSAEELRLGTARFAILVDWRPLAHRNDFRTEGTRTFGLWFTEGGARIG